MSLITLKSLERTCLACPSQWQGFTDDGRQIYIRLRYSNFCVNISLNEEADIFKTINDGDVLMELKKDAWPLDKYDADFLENDELKDLTKDLFDWSLITEIKDTEL